MDEWRRLLMSNESCCFWSDAELLHSTPVKKKNDTPLPDVGKASGLTGLEMEGAAKRCARGTSTTPADSRWLHALQETESLVKDPSASTILKQRRELQLLMMELKDREKELNAMAAAHHTQHQAWEQDHQRVLMLEQRCACLDEELQKRDEVIRILTKHTQVVETREKALQKEFSEARQQLFELQKKQEDTRAKCQDYEDKNQSLSSTVMALSTQVGSLQVREEELSSMLKLKDKDVMETSRHILELSGRLRDLETALKESRSQESKLRRDTEDNKRRYKEARHEAAQLNEELQQQVTQSSSQREEIIRLKQELQLLHRDLVLTGEGDSWKDELLELSRSKQDRIMSELHCLRQVCENQRKDLQLLRFNQENTREAPRDKTSQGFHGSQDDAACSCVDHLSPSSLRGKSFRPAHDARPAAALQASVGELGVFSAHLTDGDDLLPRCSLRQLLDESRLLDRSSSRRRSSVEHAGRPASCGATETSHLHEIHTPQHHHHHHHPVTSIVKTSETPPKARLRHGATLPASHVDGPI